MTEVAPQRSFPFPNDLQRPEVEPASNDAIASYLRHSGQFAEIAMLAEHEAIILKTCRTLELTVSDQELQAAGDSFRTEHNLLGASETLNWLETQRISAEEWTEGIRIKLLTQKLKHHLFGYVVDAHYLNARDEYRRAAFSQILVSELPEALKIIDVLRNEPTSFCAMALEHSKANPSASNGGFAGTRFISTLMPALKEAVENASVGEVIGPVQTKLGYHILRIEKWLEAKLTTELQGEILDALFLAWLTQKK